MKIVSTIPTPTIALGDVDDRAIEQLARCAAYGNATRAALCADGHVGYSQPIGGVIAYPDHVSPSAVGYDIGCGNKAVRTNIQMSDFDDGDVAKIMDEIVRRISFGVGRPNDEPVDHDVLDHIADASFAPQRQLRDLAAKQLGTVGSGNHYVDLFEDDQGYIWVGVHFGSRGFGHKTASGFLSLAAGGRFNDRAPDGEMDSPPVLIEADTDLGQAYVDAMQLAGDYATAGRDVVVNKVIEILGARTTREVHNHHNYAWVETHDDQEVWVHRKGCTPAFPGQYGFVGATMGEPSVILRGRTDESNLQRALLFSTVHGAGRVMSRTAAAGRWRQRWTCNNRNCDWVQGQGEHKPEICPSCGVDKFTRRRVQVTPGAIDWEEAQDRLRDDAIELRGAGADEAPGAYKRLDAVLDYHAETIDVVEYLYPIGVAMAGAEVSDPYKD